MGHTEPIKILIIKKSPELLKIYGNYVFSENMAHPEPIKIIIIVIKESQITENLW